MLLLVLVLVLGVKVGLGVLKFLLRGESWVESFLGESLGVFVVLVLKDLGLVSRGGEMIPWMKSSGTNFFPFMA